MLHQVTTGIVGDDGVLNPLLAKFPGRQAGTLVERTGFIHPDMDIKTMIKSSIDRCRGGAVFDAGQPSGIAVGQYIDGLTRFPAADALNQRQTVFTDFFAVVYFLLGNVPGDVPGGLNFFFRGCQL